MPFLTSSCFILVGSSEGVLPTNRMQKPEQSFSPKKPRPRLKLKKKSKRRARRTAAAPTSR